MIHIETTHVLVIARISMNTINRVGLCLALAALCCSFSCGNSPVLRSPPSQTPQSNRQTKIALQIGSSVPGLPAERMRELLTRVAGDDLVIIEPTQKVPPDYSTIIAIGSSPLAKQLISDAECQAMPPEAYQIRHVALDGMQVIAARGACLGRDFHADLYAAYALLQDLGYAFWHPLEPVLPDSLDVAKVHEQISAPRWPVRGLQLHTMHPLELTHLLQGFGPQGPNDAAGWTAFLDEWDKVLEWHIAHGQNHLHWVLLSSDAWADFVQSDTRQARLIKLVQRAHAWGMRVGVDVAIALQQQNSFRLVQTTGEFSNERAQIRERLDWLMAAGFDYIVTESGTSEFTHPEASRMLAWMNEVTRYLRDVYQTPVYIKVHASAGQVADGYIDAQTGEPLNFNFLPHYADADLGVLPHTVQIYGLDDPAPTYGNQDFRELHRFTEQQLGRRAVVWHPETAYWVSYDIDVPLFLPVYAYRRINDLHLLMDSENTAGNPLQGQLTFSSGWEWGYWLSDVLTARASWQPYAEMSSEAALLSHLQILLTPLGEVANDTAVLLSQLAQWQERVLVLGDFGTGRPADITRRSGQAYLQGVDAWDDVVKIMAKVPTMTAVTMQPDRLELEELRSHFDTSPNYQELEALLATMRADLAQFQQRFDALLPRFPSRFAAYGRELGDAIAITALRAQQMAGLYEYVAYQDPGSLQDAQLALDAANNRVALREMEYRVPLSRVSNWDTNPTAYHYGYLWTVHTMYYWWRDELKAVTSSLSPCAMNLINPAAVAMGEGPLADILRWIRDSGEGIPFLPSLNDCLAEPPEPPTLPPPGLR